MRRIVTIKFGSHLYGTSTPASDIDFKSVYIPSARDIALQRVAGSISNKRPKQTGEKNYAGEVDEESYSLQRFLGLAAEGQTVALDVLFAPEWSMVEPPAPEWRTIIDNRHRLLTKKSAAFIGYVRQQSNKYGIRGSRVATARAALTMLTQAISEHGSNAKLEVITKDLLKFVVMNEHCGCSVSRQEPEGFVPGLFEVCGRKSPLTSSLKIAHDIVERIVNEYGHRALAAEQQEGIDWKALSHAVRVGSQALELLETGNVTFPLPNAAHVIAIKTGSLPYQLVAEEIEGFLDRVETAAAASSLPDKPDHAWIEQFIWNVHSDEIVKAVASDILLTAAEQKHADHQR